MRQVVLINTKNIWSHNVVTLNISGAWFFTKSKVIVYYKRGATCLVGSGGELLSR